MQLENYVTVKIDKTVHHKVKIYAAVKNVTIQAAFTQLLLSALDGVKYDK